MESSIDGTAKVAKSGLALHALFFHHLLQSLYEYAVKDFARNIQ